MTSVAIEAPPSISAIRRKPKYTYQSPSTVSHSQGVSLLPSPPVSQSPLARRQSALNSCNSGSPTNPEPTNNLQQSVQVPTVPTRKKYLMGPPLPLYHPLGPLALSLPPLDPVTFGLPTPARLDDVARPSSGRARRPTAKVRDAEEEPQSPVDSVSTIAVGATREIRERSSPRKKRGGASKRKRKEADDGDATYPAKRTRHPRGVNIANAPVEAASPSGSTVPLGDVTPTEEVSVELPGESIPERRATRSRSALKRRDSSASEATTTSGSTKAGTPKEKDISVMDVDAAVAPAALDPEQGPGEKEEGEISEEAQS